MAARGILELKTILLQTICAVANPVRRDGKIVMLSMAIGIVYSVQAFNAEDEKMYEWNNVRPQLVTLKDGKKYLILINKNNMKALNRRKSYRVWLGVTGVAKFGNDRTTYDVIVKDISATGIAIIVREALGELLPNSVVHINFFDEDTETTFNINALFLRREELDENRTLIACRLTTESKDINKFIRDKERLNLRKHSNRYSSKRQQDFTS